ncbi:MAG: tetratricopeptide repeat protein [Planctomycetes bacterium]|nr:tetratricopeptide repeat protein [Planctomycetota bacterium]
MEIGYLQLRKRRAGDAIRTLEPVAPDEKHEMCAPARNTIGRACLLMGRVEDGISWLEKAVAMQPRNTGFLCDLAESKQYVDPESSLELLQRAEAITPDFPMIHGVRGTVLMLLGRVDEAIVAVEKEHELLPPREKNQASRALASIYAGAGRLGEAKERPRELLPRRTSRRTRRTRS